MKLILQPRKSYLCGQCCIAMLLGITLEEAIELVGHKGITKDLELIKVLSDRFQNISMVNFGKPVNKSDVILCKHRNPDNSNMEHWTILNSGVIMDPSGRLEEELWPIYKYWIVIEVQ